MGDDIGIPNISAYNHSMMGYQTPNTDRIAKEGIMFTDYYGEQSCTAGRAAFITGQHIIRTGLSKVGLPGADVGIQDVTSTLGDLLKPLGYATGQFGKNSVIKTSTYQPITDSMSFLESFITSMQRRSRKTATGQRVMPEDVYQDHVGC